jgi:hypothetical protein
MEGFLRENAWRVTAISVLLLVPLWVIKTLFANGRNKFRTFSDMRHRVPSRVMIALVLARAASLDIENIASRRREIYSCAMVVHG